MALSISNLLAQCPLTNGYEYHLSQADGAVKFLYTSLSPANAFSYLTNSVGSTNYGSIAGYDPSIGPESSGAITYTMLEEADLVRASTVGAIINTNWLALVQTNGGVGIVLMEGCATSTAPLMLEVWHKDQYGVEQKLGGVPMYLNLSGVEQMFRHYNLCGYGNGTIQVDNRFTAPNEPQGVTDVVEAQGVGQLRIDQTHDMTPRREGAGEFRHAAGPGQLWHQMIGNEIAKLAQKRKLTGGWLASCLFFRLVSKIYG